MNSKLLVSILVIGLTAIAIGGAMTGAFFSDTETSTGNTFAAGAIDLKIDSKCHYNDNVCNENGVWEGTSAYPIPGTPCDCTWLAKDLDGNPIINFADIKPGDKGESTLSIDVASNPAWVCAKISRLTNAENGCNEPELETESEGDRTPTCDNPGEGQGELQDAILFDIWRDYDCENDFDQGTDVYIVQGVAFTDLVWPIADSKHGTAVQPNEDYCIAVAWSVPSGTGNIIQSDSLKADISFEAVQARHNENFVCVPVPEVCGNGVKEGTEECDDGNLANGDGCSSTCKIEVPVCGNGAVEGDEECDEGADNGDVCTPPYGGSCNYCSLTCITTTVNGPYCGDGTTNGPEQCDDGNTVDTDACYNNCTINLCEADVMSVIDRSGSVGGNLATMKTAAHAFVTALNPRPDYAHMGQTSFATTGSLDLHLTSDKTAIDAAIDALVSNGRTNLYEGLLYANQELADGLHDRSDATSPDYMVVITDGDPNEPTDLATARSLAKAQADIADGRNTKIFVVGVGVTSTNADWLKNNIATDPTYYFDATDFGELESILQGIANCD